MSPSSSSHPAGWSDDRVTTLSKLWRDGLSASQIAQQLGGVTRNAVIGKVHRLGLSGRGAPSTPRAIAQRPARPRRPQHVAASRRTRTMRPIVEPAPAAAEGPGLIENLVYLGAHACKWPIGDPKDDGFSFCGRQAQGRYCTAHERAGTQPGKTWRVDRDPVVRRALAGLV